MSKRSESLLFFSYDQKFVIKTLTLTEKTRISNILPQLKKHYKQNPDSLLCKVFGVFTVKTDARNKVHLMLMENTVQLENSNNLKYIFDLKGCLVASSSIPELSVDLEDELKV